MKYVFYILSILMLALVLIACENNNGDETENQENPDDDTKQVTNDQNDFEEIEESNEEEESKEGDYTEKDINDPYYITAEMFTLDEEIGTLGYHFQRESEGLSREELFSKALKESDFSTSEVFSALIDVRIVNESRAELIFSADHQLTSMASSEQITLTEMIHELSYLYGIYSIDFYVEDDPGIIYGQYGEMETMEIEREDNRGHYIYEDVDEAYNDTLFLSARTVGEEIHGEELYNFEETLEAMRNINTDGQDYHSAIGDSINITEVSVDERHAKVVFDHEENEEAVTQFETALQLTALDFQFESLHLINEQNQTKKKFIFDRPIMEEDSYSIENFTRYENVRFGYAVEYPDEWNTGAEADNSDGKILHDVEDDAVDIRVFGRHTQDENVSNENEGEKIKLTSGEEAYLYENVEDNRYTFELMVIHDDITHILEGDMNLSYYETHKDIIDKVINSFELLES